MIPEKKSDDIKEFLKNATNLEMAGKFKEAIIILERAIKLNPNDGNLFNRLGDLYIKMNRPKDALSVYQKGIEAFKNDNFLRNALALCKKIMRYDPGNIDVNLTIAQLLIELDEKSDAAMYLFSYIERQMSAGNKKEVMKAMEMLKNLKVSDRTMADKMVTIYDTFGEKKKAEEVKQEISEIPVEKVPDLKTEISELHSVILDKEPERSASAQKFMSSIDAESIDRMERLTGDLQKVLEDLRRAMRIDEVVIAIDKSLSVFSQQQREAISLIHKSLHTSLENLQKTVSELQTGSRKNVEGIEKVVIQLNQSIASINSNQKLIVQEITKNLEHIGNQFQSVNQKMLSDLKELSVCYESTSQNVCAKVDENRQATTSLLKVGNETKVGIQNISDSLLKYFLNQESHAKKLNKFVFIITIILAVMAVLILISIIK
ncbi:MAG: tetratricopeptide repeat protein [bacterium]